MPVRCSPRRWHLLRFSVRGSLLLVLLLGGGLGWIVQRAQIQRDAVAAIRQAGGSVTYDWQRRTSSIPNGKFWWPIRTAAHVGSDFLGNVIQVQLTRRATDAELIHVGRLSRLED